MHEDLRIEWYGTGWPEFRVYDDETGNWREVTPGGIGIFATCVEDVAEAPATTEKVRGNNIKRSMFHDAGAYARCFYCGRYSDNPKALQKDEWPCECGKQRGWSGSFVAPTADAKWSDVTPNVADNRTPRAEDSENDGPPFGCPR